MEFNTTKRAKPVDVAEYESKAVRIVYTCPTCKTTFYNGGPGRNVIEFMCDRCGQRLRVSKRIRGFDATV